MESTKFTLSSGYDIPAIGFGTYCSNQNGLEDAVDTAIRAGYRHIDTAYAYKNEKSIGKVLKKWFDGGNLKRKEIFITSKLPIFGIHPDKVEMYLNKSLKALQIEYLDLYLIHHPVCINVDNNESPKLMSNGEVETENTDLVEVWKKMEEMVEKGQVKSIGLSNFNIAQTTKIIENCKIKPCVLQIEIHPFMQQKEIVDYCHKEGIVPVAYCPLGSPNKPNRELPDILNHPTIKKLAEKHNKSAAQIILRYHLQRKVLPIPKSFTPERIASNFDIECFELDENDIKDMENLEVGPSTRICDFRKFPGITKHKEWPFHQYK